MKIDYDVNRIPHRDLLGSSRLGTLDITPVKLIQEFGKPDFIESGDGKVVLCWTFRDPFGSVFEIYPYKATRDYYEGLPTKEQFCMQEIEFPFSLGGCSVQAMVLFIALLKEKGLKAHL